MLLDAVMALRKQNPESYFMFMSHQPLVYFLYFLAPYLSQVFYDRTIYFESLRVSSSIHLVHPELSGKHLRLANY